MRVKQLILTGAKETGSFSAGFNYIFESLPVGSAEDAKRFCEYIDREPLAAGLATIDRLYECYLTPELPANVQYVKSIRQKIEFLRSFPK